MQGDVLHRRRHLGGEIREQGAVVLVERRVAAADRDAPGGAVAVRGKGCGQGEAARARRPPPGPSPRRVLCRVMAASSAAPRQGLAPGLGGLLPRFVPGRGAQRVDRRTQQQLDQRGPVEARAVGLPHPTDRRVVAAPLVLELVELAVSSSMLARRSVANAASSASIGRMATTATVQDALRGGDDRDRRQAGVHQDTRRR